jgi:TolB-like protein/tetratricopeptide (TPR) repeat protein
MSLVSELSRRNVFRAAAAYLVVGWLLTEVLTTILPTLGAPDWAGKAVIRVFVFGFIPAIVLSWIYELTREGIKREEVADGAHATGYSSIRKRDYATITAVVLAVVFIAVFSARQPSDDTTATGPTVGGESVAVLPFVNMSNDEDNEYFSDGLTETLLHMLTQIPGLKVAARTSSFAFKGKNIGIREIADALHVDHVLEGSVQHAGNRVRITAQLIRAADGFHVWSESYDRTIDDIFAIQDEIAKKVGGALSASLFGSGGDAKVAGVDTANPDAYDLYLQALRERATYSYGGLQTAEELLKGALTIDPDFLDAKTELASNYLHQYETGLMDQNDAFTAVLAITDQVLARRPSDAGARAVQIFARAAPNSQFGSADVIVDAATQLEDIVAEHPGQYYARVLLTRLLQGLNQFDKALGLQLDALQRDPYNARIHYEIGSLYLELDQLAEAQTALQKSLDIEPLQPNAYLKLAQAAGQTGDGVEILRRLLKAMEVDPRDHEIPGFIAGFLYQFGLIEEGDDFRNRVFAIAPTSEIAHRIELLRAVNTGDEEAGLAAARRAIEDDIEDRQFSYGGAVQLLMRVAANRGTVEETAAYLEQQAPGIFDIGAMSSPAKYRTAQLTAFDAWFTTLPRDELLRRIEKMSDIVATFGLDPLDDPRTQVDVAALQGDVAQAIQVALSDVFSQPVTMNLGWRVDFGQAQFTQFVEDPRIQAAMQNWENEETALRDQLKTFLSDLRSTSSG